MSRTQYRVTVSNLGEVYAGGNTRAEQDTAEARQEIHRINAEALALVREIKKQGRAFSPAICQALRGQLLEFMGDRREQFARMESRA